MNAQKQTSPAGELIEAARREMGLSQNAAARQIGISGTRWRQIVKGTGTTEGGRVSVRGGAETVAKMAMLVGVTADEMESVGRADVAREITGAGPLSAPEQWDGERVGPDDLLHADERLLWKDEARGRFYRLADRDDASVHAEHLFYPGETPGEVIDDLRDLLAPFRVAKTQVERRRSRR